MNFIYKINIWCVNLLKKKVCDCKNNKTRYLKTKSTLALMECILSPHDIINQSDYNVPVIIFGFPGISDIHCNQFLLKKFSCKLWYASDLHAILHKWYFTLYLIHVLSCPFQVVTLSLSGRTSNSWKCWGRDSLGTCLKDSLQTRWVPDFAQCLLSVTPWQEYYILPSICQYLKFRFSLICL